MKWWQGIVVLALVAGTLLRMMQLDLRPMHTDEAVHAVKFGALLEQGTYRYDKNEYHGPTLNYLTLIPAFLSSERTLADVTESTLRIVPVFFGLMLILLLVLIKDIGWKTVAFAAAFTALSPSMVFYSKYYIQEMLLVCFTFGLLAAGYRLLSDGRTRWAVLAGLFAGLMFATKETWLISAGAMSLSLVGVLLLRRKEHRPELVVRTRNILIALLCATAVSITFYSSFFTNWQGIADSALAFTTYFSRAGQSLAHGHPWYYFLQLLMFEKGTYGPMWSEAAIVVFGIIGVWSAIRKRADPGEHGRDLILFVAMYAMIMLLISSVLPYKTPWLMLGIFQPLIIAAGYGVVSFLQWMNSPRFKVIGISFVSLVMVHLGWQAYQASFIYYDDPVNPYVYSQPTLDVKLAADFVKEIARRSPDGAGLPVQVIYPFDGYWPLPWYLRSLKKVGWWNAIGKDFVPTPIILTSPDFEPELSDRIYAGSPDKRLLYVPLFTRSVFLRPGKEIRGYITLDLWNKIQPTGAK